MIKELIFTGLLACSVSTGSMQSQPIKHNVQYYDNDYLIVLSSYELNNYVFVNLNNFLVNGVYNPISILFESVELSSAQLNSGDSDYVIDSDESAWWFTYYITLYNDTQDEVFYLQLSFNQEDETDYMFHIFEGVSDFVEEFTSSVYFYINPLEYSVFKSAIQLDIADNQPPEPPSPTPITLYDICYNYFSSILNNEQLSSIEFTIGGQTLNMNSWLAHTITISLFVLGIIFLIICLRWIFRQFAGLI